VFFCLSKGEEQTKRASTSLVVFGEWVGCCQSRLVGLRPKMRSDQIRDEREKKRVSDFHFIIHHPFLITIYHSSLLKEGEERNLQSILREKKGKFLSL